MISEHIKKFASVYPSFRAEAFQHNDITRLVTEVVPNELLTALTLDPKEYLIKGSIGGGNWADVPWMAIMQRGITTTTQNGYYVVLLFERDMSAVYISLGLGWTQFKDRYGNRTGKQRVKEYSERLKSLLSSTEGTRAGEIDLGAQTPLGKGYEVSNIISLRLDIRTLDDPKLTAALTQMMHNYKDLMEQFGADLFYEHEPEAEDELPEMKKFTSQVKQKSLQVDKERALQDLVALSDMQPPSRRQIYVDQILRNAAFANFVKKRARYTCEICGMKPFMKKSKQPYAEADHVIPLGEKGVDHPDNMRCLCAQCHRVITYGAESEIAKLFI